MNKLVRQFDSAAENLGVEQVRTLHNGYLASCGLSVPRMDNVRRTVDFAIEMHRIIDRFNTDGRDLKLRAGIDTGQCPAAWSAEQAWPTTFGAQAVNLAFQVQSGAPQPGIYRHDAGVRRDARHPSVRPGGDHHRRRYRAAGLAAGRSGTIGAVLDTSWFYWVIGVAIGLPSRAVCSPSSHIAQPGRRSYLARPVHLFRNYDRPAGYAAHPPGERRPRSRRRRHRCASWRPCSASWYSFCCYPD